MQSIFVNAIKPQQLKYYVHSKMHPIFPIHPCLQLIREYPTEDVDPVDVVPKSYDGWLRANSDFVNPIGNRQRKGNKYRDETINFFQYIFCGITVEDDLRIFYQNFCTCRI